MLSKKRMYFLINYKVEASEPKRVNSNYNKYEVNRLRLGRLRV